MDLAERSMADAPAARLAARRSPRALLLRVYPALGNSHFRLLWLVGGVAADRFPRRRVLITTQSTLSVSAAVIAALTLSGLLQIWHLLAFGFIQGVAFAFNMPTRQAYIADIVGPNLIRNAVALNNAGMNCSRVAGPALGGALLAAPGIGVGGIFAVMAALYGAVVLSLLRIPDAPLADSTSAHHSERRRGGSWAHLMEGLRYIRSSRALPALLGMAFLVLFFGMPYQSLLPLFSVRVFGVGGGGLGALMAAVGFGALAGSLSVAALSHASRPTLLQLGFGVGFGLALIAFALSPSFPLAVVALVAVGYLSSAYSVLNNTLVMGNTEP